MKKILYGTFLTLVLVFAAGAVSSVNAQEISGSIGTIKRGGAGRGTIVMSVPGGLHVNSNSPNSEYAIPTTVKISAVGAKVGAVSYPRGKNRKFAFSEDNLNVYESRAAFGFNVTVPSSYKGSTIKVRAVVRFQACTEEVCYAPKTKEITLTAQIR